AQATAWTLGCWPARLALSAPTAGWPTLALDDYLAAVETAGADEADGRAVLRKNGQVVLVKEADPSRDGALCVTSGTPAALLDELLSTSAANVDASFADDLLLTRLAFVSDLALADRLLLALADPPQPDLRAQRRLGASRTCPTPMGRRASRRHVRPLAGLEARLTGRLGPQHLMRLACSSGAAERRVTCRRDRGLDFLLLGSGGGGDSFCFVSGLAAPTGDEDDSCLIDDEGRLLQPLMLGDRVLQLDDQPVDPDRLSNGAAGELLHLTVRWDPLQYHRALASMTAAASVSRWHL
uniref:PDZ domain-containing protein n=1 Tax=Macrostomum lignano TaxID=282301 RepID=A0A1I8GVZ8_9PLAT